jgi:CMP-N-acetylneuraminic acid synthetase
MGSRVNIRSRPAELCTDEASTRDVLLDVVKWWGMTPDDIIVLLYLTYPERKTVHISDATAIFQASKSNSMLCRKKPLTDPYMCIYDDGRQVVEHDLYRRQDYPVTHEISHFIGVFRVSEIPKLNKNLYNRETFFMPIERFIDVDTEEDYRRLQ